MGIPGEFEHPIFKEAINYILKTGLEMGVPAGLHIVEPDLVRLREVIAEGYRFIAYSVDVRMLDVIARAGVDAAEAIR